MPAVRAGGTGRLIFAMDATASREPSWDRACRIQGDMFSATETLGGLEIQLAWYRGLGEFEASGWLRDSHALVTKMTQVTCRAGETQIARVLQHAIAETGRRKVNAMVFVGDCVEENVDALCGRAGMSAEQVSSELLRLELEGRVAALPGGLFQRLEKRHEQ